MKKSWIIVVVVALVLFGAVVAYAHPLNNAKNYVDDQETWLADRAEWLEVQVKEGNLTQEEADAMLAIMEERMDDEYCFADDDDAYNGRYSKRSFGRSGMFGGGCFR